MTAKKETLITIVMPVGVDAGNKIKVTKDQAQRIKRDFGEWNGKTSAAEPKSDEAIAALEKSLASEREHSESLGGRIGALEKTFKDTLGERMETIAELDFKNSEMTDLVEELETSVKVSDEIADEQTKRADAAEAKVAELEKLLDAATAGNEDKVTKK